MIGTHDHEVHEIDDLFLDEYPASFLMILFTQIDLNSRYGYLAFLLEIVMHYVM